MDRKFDLRLEQDRDNLADLLPNIDADQIALPAAIFRQALRDVSAFLGEPDWLTYQWGVVGPFRDGSKHIPLTLRQVVDLGIELRDLSRHDNFAAHLDGFANPTQFIDTMFETHTASFFSRLNTTVSLRFAQLYQVRGHAKRPDFDVVNALGVVSVECKRPHLHVQNAVKVFERVADALRTALEASDWPRDARLEIEMMGPLPEPPARFAARILKTALDAWQAGPAEFAEGCYRGFVVPRDSPFRVLDPKLGLDVMVLDTDEPTALFNPKVTSMRIANNRLDRMFSVSTGARITEALRQLPDDHYGIIAIGGVPRRIANEVIARRIDDPAYDHVLAFLVCEDNHFTFCHRTSRRDQLQRMLSDGLRPQFNNIGN